MKQQKWSGVKADRKRIKEYRHEKIAEILAEIFLFGAFVLFLAAIAAFLLEITR